RLQPVGIDRSVFGPSRLAIVKTRARQGGGGFRFLFQATGQITHILKLGKGSVEATERLGITLRSLGEKNGPILFQLPPYSKQDLKLLEDFLTSTSKIGERVFEFRHESWLNDATYTTLEKHDADFCIAETEDM